VIGTLDRRLPPCRLRALAAAQLAAGGRILISRIWSPIRLGIPWVVGYRHAGLRRRPPPGGSAGGTQAARYGSPLVSLWLWCGYPGLAA